jgi:hypothetical protein
VNQEMECMCLQCGASSYLLSSDIVLENPANIESKLLSSPNVCQLCGGQLSLAGKAGDEPHYRVK